MKLNLKQKQDTVSKFRDFLSKKIGLIVTDSNGNTIDVQKEFKIWVEKEFGFKS